MSALDDLKSFLREESNIIDAKFRQISSQGYPTPQEISDFKEGVFNSFIARYFPSPYKITKGNIRDISGKKSLSIDTVIVTPEHPHTIDDKGKHQLLFAEGVHACIELKPNIKSKKEFYRSLKQVETVKLLQRSKTPLLLSSSRSQKLICESLKVPCFIFSMSAKNDIDEVISDIVSFYSEHSTPLELQFDHLIIHKVGIISNYKLEEMVPISDKRPCILFEPWGDDTLAGMIFKLSSVIHATPSMTEGIMMRYLRGFSFSVKKYPSINTYTSAT